jgi:hypothetical protein
MPKRALAACCVAMQVCVPWSMARADNLPPAFLPGALPYAGLAQAGSLPPGLLPQGMYLPVYPGMYPLMPSPYMAYPGLLPSYLGGVPMALPGLLPTLPIPPGALLQGSAPPASASTPAQPGPASGPEGIAPFTGFQLPSIGGMTELDRKSVV